jgi:hypothetical protein
MAAIFKITCKMCREMIRSIFVSLQYLVSCSIFVALLYLSANIGFILEYKDVGEIQYRQKLKPEVSMGNLHFCISIPL